jgi:hypothetical protein
LQEQLDLAKKAEAAKNTQGAPPVTTPPPKRTRDTSPPTPSAKERTSKLRKTASFERLRTMPSMSCFGDDSGWKTRIEEVPAASKSPDDAQKVAKGKKDEKKVKKNKGVRKQEEPASLPESTTDGTSSKTVLAASKSPDDAQKVAKGKKDEKKVKKNEGVKDQEEPASSPESTTDGTSSNTVRCNLVAVGHDF